MARSVATKKKAEVTDKALKPATARAKKWEASFVEPPDKAQAEARARMALRPSVNAAAVAIEYTNPLGQQDIGALVTMLADDINALWAGDMQRTEAMLFAQAHALQAIFMNLARRATTQEYMKNWEAYLRMALKAQNQCRMTLETLATVKNPPVVFARQANINNGGQQQVNNAATGGGTEKSETAGRGNPSASHAENFSSTRTAIKPPVQTELLGRNGHKRTSRAPGNPGAPHD